MPQNFSRKETTFSLEGKGLHPFFLFTTKPVAGRDYTRIKGRESGPGSDEPPRPNNNNKSFDFFFFLRQKKEKVLELPF
jgi:hypothetical protein